MKWSIVGRVIVDLGMGVTMLTSLVTGVAIWLLIPEGQGSGQYVLWGLSKHQWNDVHLYVSLGFAVLLAVHLILNRRLFHGLWRASLRELRGAQP